MSRTAERLIDLVVLWSLLGFAFAMRFAQPALSGIVVAAAVQFWLTKNAAPPHMPDPKIAEAATAAAAVLAVAKEVTEPGVDHAT